MSVDNMSVDNEYAYLGRSRTRTISVGWWSDSLVRNAVIGWTASEQVEAATPSELQLVPGKKFIATLSAGTHTTKAGIFGTAILSKNQLSEENIDISNGLDYVGQVTLTFNFGV